MHFEVFRARPGMLRRTQWRWRLRADNSRIIASSGEGYNNRSDALYAIHLIKKDAAGAPIKGVDLDRPDQGAVQ